MIKLVSILIMSICLTTIVCAASFDCNKVNTDIEKKVCANEDISKLDDKLNKVYNNALLVKSSKEIIIEQQLLWIRNVRNACNNTECLKAKYEERISALNLTNFNKSQLIGDWCSAPCYYATPTRPYDLPCDFRITESDIQWHLHKHKYKRPYEIINQTKNKEILLLSGGNEYSWYSSSLLSTAKHKLIFDAGKSYIIEGEEDLELSDYSYNISSKTWDLESTVFIKRGKCGN